MSEREAASTLTDELWEAIAASQGETFEYDNYEEAAAEADYLAELAAERAWMEAAERRAESGTWFGGGW